MSVALNGHMSVSPAVKTVYLKVHATLVPNFLLGLCADARRIACPSTIVDQCRITVQVVFKERVVQQVSKAIDKDMTREMSTSFLESTRENDPAIYGLFCCGACYNTHPCGGLNPVDYL